MVNRARIWRHHGTNDIISVTILVSLKRDKFFNWPSVNRHIHVIKKRGKKRILIVKFFFLVAEKGLDHVAENILSYLDAESLGQAELVCKEWHRVISEGMLWKKLIERKVKTDPLWRGLAERRGWWVLLYKIWSIRIFVALIFLYTFSYCRIRYLFKPKPGQQHPDHFSYRTLFPKILRDIEVSKIYYRQLNYSSDISSEEKSISRTTPMLKLWEGCFPRQAIVNVDILFLHFSNSWISYSPSTLQH